MLRTWNTNFQPNPHSATAVYVQIAEMLSEDIRRGRLRPGTALPGSRQLARQLGVNRKTVVLAYEELLAQGWLETQHKRGTFVSSKLPIGEAVAFTAPVKPAGDTGFTWHEPIGLDYELPSSVPGRIVFNDGTPDGRLMPIGPLATAYRRALRHRSHRNQLGYDSSAGSLVLREALSQMLNHDRGLNTTPDSLCLTRGTQMGLYLTALLLVCPGDVVAFENPGYPPAWHTFRLLGAELAPLPVDGEGLSVDALEALCIRRSVRALYLTPHHQFPTTVTLKAARRLQLMAVAVRYGVVIIEDDYDHDFHYQYQPMLPLASADTQRLVVYLGSFSKLLAPALRMGYVAGPPAFIESLVRLRRLIDHQGDIALEHAIAELIADGELKRHTRRAHAVYWHRRDTLIASLKHYMVDQTYFEVPEGGLALWLQFNKSVDLERVAIHLAMHKIIITPGIHYYFDQPASNALRLGFASLTPPELVQGVELLSQAVRDVYKT